MGLRFNPDAGPIEGGVHYRYYVQWRWGDAMKEEYLSIAQLKELFPSGKRREDLKRYVDQAHAKWAAGDESRVKIDGSREHLPVHVSVPLPLSAPVPAPPALVWPVVPYYQEAHRACAFNAIRNLGFDLPPEREADDVKSLINLLQTSGFHFL